MSIRLGVNIDHVATLRQARGGVEPSVIDAALLCEKCGVSGITVHLREDRRHIQDSDVFEIREKVNTRLNLEMALSDEIVAIALKVKPFMVTLVPEKRQELTTEGGLDVVGQFEKIRSVSGMFNDAGIAVSLFIEPDDRIVEFSHATGASHVEFHTGTYSLQSERESIARELDRLYRSAEQASSMGIIVNAGHGLNYVNVEPVLKMKNLNELNIGHSIISRAVFCGLEKAVLEMKTILERG